MVELFLLLLPLLLLPLLLISLLSLLLLSKMVEFLLLPLSLLSLSLETLVLGRPRRSDHLVRAVTQQVFPEIKHLELVLYDNLSLYQIVMSHGWRNQLTSLTLTRIPAIQDFDLLREFNRLEKVHLGFDVLKRKKREVIIQDIINALPAATLALSLENANITNNLAEINEDSNVFNLKLKSCEFISENMSQFLTTRFPQLKSLALYYCTSVGNLHLPNHDLDYFEYTISGAHRGIPLKGNIINRIQSWRKYLQVNIQDTSYFFRLPENQNFRVNPLGVDEDRPLKQVLRPYVDDIGDPLFNITCRSIREAHYGGYLLLFN